MSRSNKIWAAGFLLWLASCFVHGHDEIWDFMYGIGLFVQGISVGADFAHLINAKKEKKA